MGSGNPNWWSWELGSHAYSGWLFLRLLGLVYLSAFLSLGGQIRGLIGQRGIMPLSPFLADNRWLGAKRWVTLPTLCWWNSSSRFLVGLCWAGSALAVALFCGFAPALVLALLWVCYLSLTTAGRTFMAFQWDVLLLETGFIAILFAPLEIRPRGPATDPPLAMVGLYYWLLFRLMFGSAWVKWRSGDRSWRDGTALNFHYETQPLPTPLSWYLHKLPNPIQKVSVWAMFGVEFGLALCLCGPLICRVAAAVGFALLMLLILASGNYGFFNWLTIFLCVVIVPDQVWAPMLSPWEGSRGVEAGPHWPDWIVWPFAVGLFALSLPPFLARLGMSVRWPRFIVRAVDQTLPFHLANVYGLFSVMTHRRLEIVIEGSRDGREWLPYEFRWKPGDPRRPPPVVAPHQPRLDWQMWFAALSSPERQLWFEGFLNCLLAGSPDVTRLLARNPFPDTPPRFVRGLLFVYRFSSRAERRASGRWWNREFRWTYWPSYSRHGFAKTRPPQ